MIEFLQLIKMGIIIPTAQAIDLTVQGPHLAHFLAQSRYPIHFNFPSLVLVSCPHLTSGPYVTIASQRSPLSHCQQPGSWMGLSSPFLLTHPLLLLLLLDRVNLIK